MTNIEYLKANRNEVIKHLTSTFKFEAIELKDLMTALIRYSEVEELELEKMYIDSVINMMLVDYTNGTFEIANGGVNASAIESHEQYLASKNKQINNLHN